MPIRSIRLPIRVRRATLLSGLALVLGCSAGGSGDPTFHSDVRPILQSQCVSCHKEGGIAPFALTTYAEAKAFSASIGAEVEARRMPPFNVDNSGSCRTYEPARWLSAEAISTITRWAESGAPPGEATLATPAAEPPETVYVEGDATMQTPAFTPDRVPDQYRCFLLDPGLADDAYMTGLQVRPGAPEIVHHMLLFTLDSPAAVAEAQAEDDAAPGPGFDCYSLGIEESFIEGNSRLVSVWAPGVPATRFPAGTGIPVTSDVKVMVQIHYNTLNGKQEDSTRLDLLLADAVERPAEVALLDDFSLDLAPGKPAVTHETTFNVGVLSAVYKYFGEGQREVLGVFPHMHELGTRQRLEYHDPQGDEHCLHDVERWDFNWQEFFFFASGQEVTIDPAGRLTWTCTYDTTDRTEPVDWGEGTADEMCMVFLYTVPAE